MVKFLLGMNVLALVWTHPVTAEELSLKPGHPERYVGQVRSVAVRPG